MGGVAHGRVHVRRGCRGHPCRLARAHRRCRPHADGRGVPDVGLARIPDCAPAGRLAAHLRLPSLPGARRLQQRPGPVLHRRGHRYEAVHRLREPVEVLAWPMLAVAVVGLATQHRRLFRAARRRARQPQRQGRDAARDERPVRLGGRHPGRADHPGNGLDADRPVALRAGCGADPLQCLGAGARTPATSCSRRRPPISTYASSRPSSRRRFRASRTCITCTLGRLRRSGRW